MNFDLFSDPFKSGLSSSSGQDLLSLKTRFGGGYRVPRKPVQEAVPEETEPGQPPPEAEEKKSKVILKNPKWEIESVGFNEETEISVEVELPEEHAHKKKILFELYAKTPAEPERITQAEGFEEDGKAKAKIPVYQPNYKEEGGSLLAQVDYYFTAKHSLSDLLKDENAFKTVDGKAERVIESHVLEEATFDFDISFLHPKHAATLKALCDRIEGWREKYPEGTIAVFGHADAVGKEQYNKGLSERRARSVHAFLVKEVADWEALHGEEKWGLKPIQSLLQHLGHDPGAVDGVEGAKTQAAVKAFQAKAGIKADGKAGPKTREAMFRAFVDGLNELKLEKKVFEDINGSPIAGCSEFNLLEDTQDADEQNRRVTVLLLKSSKKFPVHYPCKAGDVEKCRVQVKKNPGKRRKASFKCCFYDELVKEEGGGGAETGGDLPVYDPGEDFESAEGCALADEECCLPGEEVDLPIHRAEWNVEKARCGGMVKLTAHSSLPDGTEVAVKFATEELKCDEGKARVKDGKIEFEWRVKGVGFALNEEKKVLPEVEVFASFEYSGEKVSPDKTLKVQTLVKTEPAEFDKSYKWGIYSVHSKFTQKVWGRAQKVHVKKKILKTWGATYVNLSVAKILDAIPGMPWPGHRWAKSNSGHMVPDLYWDGKKWKDIPDGVLDDPQNFSTLPIIKTGGKSHHPGDPSFEWPDPSALKDYEFEASVYSDKRKAWKADSDKRWSRVFKLRRKGCTADPKTNCCTYDLSLEFEMVKTESYDSHTLCLAPGNLRSNAGLLFYGEKRLAMCAHEVGHLVGLPDEYLKGAVDESVNGDGAVKGIDKTTLMGGDLAEANCKIKKRHYSNFLHMARRISNEAGGADQEWVAV